MGLHDGSVLTLDAILIYSLRGAVAASSCQSIGLENIGSLPSSQILYRHSLLNSELLMSQ
jgi:hypothetical protein